MDGDEEIGLRLARDGGAAAQGDEVIALAGQHGLVAGRAVDECGQLLGDAQGDVLLDQALELAARTRILAAMTGIDGDDDGFGTRGGLAGFGPRLGSGLGLRLHARIGPGLDLGLRLGCNDFGQRTLRRRDHHHFGGRLFRRGDVVRPEVRAVLGHEIEDQAVPVAAVRLQAEALRGHLAVEVEHHPQTAFARPGAHALDDAACEGIEGNARCLGGTRNVDDHAARVIQREELVLGATDQIEDHTRAFRAIPQADVAQFHRLRERR